MKRGVYRLVLGGSIFFVLVIILYGFQLLVSSKYCVVVHTDPLLSQESCQRLDIFFQKFQSLVSMRSLINNVTKEFPFVKSAYYVFRAQGTIDIFVTSHRPCFLLNSTHVLLEKAIVLQKYFNTDYLCQLPQVFCEQHAARASSDLCQFFLAIPYFLCQNYYITWQDKTHIFFKEKQSESYTILADDTSCFNSEKMRKVADIFCKHYEKDTQEKPQNLVYDIRFNDQIVEYVMKGIVV